MKFIIATLMAAASARRHHHGVHDLVQIQSDPMFSSLGYESRHYKGEGDNNEAPTPYPINYAVPNFGQDSDVKDSLRNVADVEKELGQKWDILKAPAAAPPRNYFVPNFGKDQDISSVDQSLAAAEKASNHTWTWKNYVPPDRYERLMPIYQEERPMDEDVAGTLNNLAQSEQKLSHKYSAYE